MTENLPPLLGPTYGAAALQMTVHAVNRCPDRESARVRMNATIAFVAEKVRGTKHWMGPSLKLVVLPEYFLTCYPQGEPVAAWAEALERAGRQVRLLSTLAGAESRERAAAIGAAWERLRHGGDGRHCARSYRLCDRHSCLCADQGADAGLLCPA